MKSLTKVELDALLTVARKHSERDYLMFLVTFNHGLRVSETISLNAENFAVDGHIIVQRLKGSKKTIQPLLASEKGLLALVNGTEPLFPMSRWTFNRRLEEYGAEAGIPRFKLHAHVLKHTTGRLGYEGGMGIPELQRYLGHACGSNTMIYLEATEEQAASAFAAAVGK